MCSKVPIIFKKEPGGTILALPYGPLTMGILVYSYPSRYLLYRVLDPLGPYIVGTWRVRDG